MCSLVIKKTMLQKKCPRCLLFVYCFYLIASQTKKLFFFFMNLDIIIVTIGLSVEKIEVSTLYKANNLFRIRIVFCLNKKIFILFLRRPALWAKLSLLNKRRKKVYDYSYTSYYKLVWLTFNKLKLTRKNFINIMS